MLAHSSTSPASQVLCLEVIEFGEFVNFKEGMFTDVATPVLSGGDVGTLLHTGPTVATPARRRC